MIVVDTIKDDTGKVIRLGFHGENRETKDEPVAVGSGEET